MRETARMNEGYKSGRDATTATSNCEKIWIRWRMEGQTVKDIKNMKESVLSEGGKASFDRALLWSKTQNLHMVALEVRSSTRG
jgi:hypothetical protein